MFKNIQTKNELASILNTSTQELEILLTLSFLKYKKGTIPKKDGTPRNIEKPNNRLKIVQKSILNNILLRIAIQQFNYNSKGQSHIKSAKAHIGTPYLLVSDIKNFFPSIHFSKIRRIFFKAGFSSDISNALARLTTKDYQLPQGAPTSPLLASLAITEFDTKLNRFCHKYNLTYTRFADDIAISGFSEAKIMLAKKYLLSFLKQSMLKMKPNKTDIFGPGKDKLIMGILVRDNGLRLEKNKLDQFINELRQISKDGPAVHVHKYKNYQHMKWSLLGRTSYIKQVEGARSGSYCMAMQILGSIDWNI